jgi:acetyl/propionyl-CoA carboxylase alpha subunit
LDEYLIQGIKTSVSFFRDLVREEAFLQGEFDTGFVDRFLENKKSSQVRFESRLAELAAIAAVLHARDRSSTSAASIEQVKESGWKLYGRVALRRGRMQ